MKLHTGDSVVVIAGKDKGKQGTVMRVLESKGRLVVEGINMRTRHIKKTTQGAGQRIKYEASIHVSNVMLIDPKTKKPTRIGYKVDAKTGKKVRFAIGSGEILPAVSKAKAEKKTKKSAAKPENMDPEKATKAAKKDEMAPEKMAGPSKQPFWKRAFSGNEADGTQGETRNRQDEIDKNSPSSIRRSRESS